MRRIGSSGASRAASRIVSSPWSGISLPTKRNRNGSSARQPAWKRRSSAPTRQTRTRDRGISPSSARKSAFASVSATTMFGSRSARRSTMQEDLCREQPLAEALAVGDERLVERDERVEDERLLARNAARAGDVEVAGIADDDRVEAVARPRTAAETPPPRAGAPCSQRRPTSCRGVRPRPACAVRSPRRPRRGARTSPRRSADSRARRSRSRGRARHARVS